jgi:hypothetical protein
MNVRKFLDEYNDSGLPKRTTADVPAEDLIPVKTRTGALVAVNSKTGEMFRSKERSAKDGH